MSTRRMLSSYTAGIANRLRSNGSGSAEGNISFSANGNYDTAAAASLIATGGGTNGYWVKWESQFGLDDAEQSAALLQPLYGTALLPFGAMQGGAETFMSLPFLSLTAPYYVHAVVNYAGSTAAINHIFATAGSITTNYLGITAAFKLRMNLGTSLSSTVNVNTGKRVLGWLVNGASSKGFVDGIEVMSGNAGTNSPSSWQIGGGGSLGNNFFNLSANNAIAEFLIFSGNPTNLAGWSNFINGTKTFFGVV
jgi:hypothetical protein